MAAELACFEAEDGTDVVLEEIRACAGAIGVDADALEADVYGSVAVIDEDGWMAAREWIVDYSENLPRPMIGRPVSDVVVFLDLLKGEGDAIREIRLLHVALDRDFLQGRGEAIARMYFLDEATDEAS
ncbi:MAG: hypothetical protein RID91_22180 [Azospirillaceae bacterium]